MIGPANHPAAGKAGTAHLLAIEHHCPGLPEPGRWHHYAFMRLIVILFVLTVCASVRADIPAYTPMRSWVEKSCATNTLPKDERVFIGHGSASADYATILRYHKSISLREIIDETPYKGKIVTVLVMRPDDANPNSGGFFREIKPTETPDFVVKPLDLIWIYTGVPIF